MQFARDFRDDLRDMEVDDEENGTITDVNVPEPPHEEETNFVSFPMYSIGTYLALNLPDIQNLSWSFDLVKTDITSEGLARLFHELYPFLPINGLDELVNRCEEGGVSIADVSYWLVRIDVV